jgi:hypothetical protein
MGPASDSMETIVRRACSGNVSRLFLAVALVLVIAAATPPSSAAAPRNGPIAYSFEEQLDGPCLFCEEEEAGGLARSWIELVRPSGGPPTRLPCTTGSFDSCGDGRPQYSRDGKRLAVVNRREIVIARPAGEVLRRIPVAAATVAWSPDGRRLAYTKSYTKPRTVVRHAVYVGDRQLARNVHPFGLSWSARGLLAWERLRGRRGVYVSNPRGGDVRRILPAQDLPRQPRWSYDGRRLAYACANALCAAAADGTGRRLLTRRCNMEYDLGGGMAWSPDGRWVACTSRASGDLITVRLGSDERRIVRRRPDSARFLPMDVAWRPLPARQPRRRAARGAPAPR